MKKNGCLFLGKTEYAETVSGELKEVHRCKNKKIEFLYCESAIKFGLCDGEPDPCNGRECNECEIGGCEQK